MIKKINAVLAYITAILILLHVLFMGLVLIGVTGFNPLFAILGKVLVHCFCAHILIALFIMFFNSGSGIKYPKLNKSTIEQRIASILLLIFIHFHMQNYFVSGNFVAPSVFGYVTEILFIFIIMSHFMPSVDKGLITLGICNKGTVMLVKILALLSFLFSLVSVSFYFLGALI